jgi:hypothetical protein
MGKRDSYLIVMLSLSVSCFYASIFIDAFFCLNFTAVGPVVIRLVSMMSIGVRYKTDLTILKSAIGI